MEDLNYDWSTFSRRIGINADTQSIFEAWTSQNKLEKWFLSRAVFSDTIGIVRPKESIIQFGDEYSWEWYTSANVAKGEIKNIVPLKSIEMTFLGCDLKVLFYKEHGENVVEVVQSRIPIDKESKATIHIECIRGWTFYLTNLKSILEGGLDLRNKNDMMKRVINT